MKKHLWTPIVALALAGGFVAEATAQDANWLVATRKSAMTLQAKYFGDIYEMTQPGGAYDAARAARNADYLTVITKLAWDDFQQSTAGAARTWAKDEIFKETAKFKERQDALQSNVQKLSAAAKAGDQAGVGAAAKNVARACNSCHEDFTRYKSRFKVE